MDPLPIRPVPASLFRSRAGRLHLRNRCTGGATPSTVRVVHLNQAQFEEAVHDNHVCRCVDPYRKV